MLVDFSAATMQVTLYIAIMQLEVSTALLQVRFPAANM